MGLVKAALIKLECRAGAQKTLDKLPFGCVYIDGETEFPTLSRRNTDYQLVVNGYGGRKKKLLETPGPTFCEKGDGS